MDPDDITPDAEAAEQFAIMLSSGMPGEEAIQYFMPADARRDEDAILEWLQTWLGSRLVVQAKLKIQGQPWHQMSLDEKVRFATEKHYAELAYFLYKTNYVTLKGHDKSKADTCRTVLEAKLAGTSGKSPLERFYEDVLAGKTAGLKMTEPVERPDETAH